VGGVLFSLPRSLIPFQLHRGGRLALSFFSVILLSRMASAEMQLQPAREHARQAKRAETAQDPEPLGRLWALSPVKRPVEGQGAQRRRRIWNKIPLLAHGRSKWIKVNCGSCRYTVSAAATVYRALSRLAFYRFAEIGGGGGAGLGDREHI